MRFKNKVLECIYTRRSIRRYLDKSVPKAVINELLKAAVMAPSAMNTQPWHFSIVTDKKVIKELAERVIKDQGLIGTALKYGYKLLHYESIFYNAPLLIVISGPRDYDWLKEDTNLAVENMFLAAKSLGLGSCWIGFAKVLDKDEDARRKLGIPYSYEISAPIIFGYPAVTKKLIPERKVKILKWID